MPEVWEQRVHRAQGPFNAATWVATAADHQDRPVAPSSPPSSPEVTLPTVRGYRASLACLALAAGSIALSIFVIGKEHYVRLCTYATPFLQAAGAVVMAVGGLALVARSSRRGRTVLVLALVVAVALAGVAVSRLPGFPRNCGL